MSLPTLADRRVWREEPRQRKPVMFQKWRDLLFLHWQVEPALIQATLPPGLFVDTFAGSAYLGLVPFFMCDIRPRLLPAVPGISNFLETNIRTYVYDKNGTPGVWFYSLDASQWLAVFVARTFFKLPYYHARMKAVRAAGMIQYETRRRNTRARASVFHYQPQDKLSQAEPGTLEFFLVERYILFAETRSGLACGQVYHTPYPIQPVNVSQWDDALLEQAGFARPQRPPDHVLMSPGVNVKIYALLPAAQTHPAGK
ncbi:MAG: YqjF family protein [Candidatus Promineifilaceae bacterium]